MSGTGKSTTVALLRGRGVDAVDAWPTPSSSTAPVPAAARSLPAVEPTEDVSPVPASGVGEVAVALRWADVDAIGHVYHATYLTLLDEARSRYLAASGVHDPSDHVVARVEVDYLAPVGPGHREVLVRHEVERVGTTSLTLRSVLRTPDGVDRARSRVVVVLWDVAASRPRPLRDDERAALARLPAAGATIVG